MGTHRHRNIPHTACCNVFACNFFAGSWSWRDHILLQST